MNLISYIKQKELKAQLWAKRHLVAALTACFGLGLFAAGLWGTFENYQLHKVQQQLNISNTQNKRLLNKQAEIILTAERLRATNQALTESIRQQEQDNRDLERGLDFYRKLMDPAKVKDGLVLENFSIASIDDSNMFRLHFTFVQYALKRNLMRADLTLQLKGLMDGKNQVIDFTEVVYQPTNNQAKNTLQSKLSFKYFQELEQLIKIPDGFSPTSLIIKATLKNKKRQRWAEEIPWPHVKTSPTELHTVPLSVNSTKN